MDTDTYLNRILKGAPKKDEDEDSDDDLNDCRPSHTKGFDRKSHYGTLKQQEYKTQKKDQRSCARAFCSGVLFFVNLLFILCAVLLIVVGIILMHREKDEKLAEVFNVHQLEWTVVGFSIGLILFAFYGIAAARWNNRCTLCTYGCVLVLMVLASLGITTFLFIFKLDDSVGKKMLKPDWDKAMKNDPQKICRLMNALQCSGFDQEDKREPPICEMALPEKHWDRTCFQAVRDEMGGGWTLPIVSGGVLLALVLGVVATVVLYKRKKLDRNHATLLENL